MVALLLEKGADATIKNRWTSGETALGTALDMARYKEHTVVVALLEAHAAGGAACEAAMAPVPSMELSWNLYKAALKGDTLLVQRLVDAKAGVEYVPRGNEYVRRRRVRRGWQGY